MHNYNSVPILRTIVRSIFGSISLINVILLIASGSNLDELSQIFCLLFGMVSTILYIGDVTNGWRVNHKLSLVIMFLNSCTVAFYFDLDPAPIYVFIPGFIVSIAVLNQKSSVRGAALIYILAMVVCFSRGDGDLKLTYFPYMIFGFTVLIFTIATSLKISSNRNYFFKYKKLQLLLEKKREAIRYKTKHLKIERDQLHTANKELEVRSEENHYRVEYLTTINEELGQIVDAAGQDLKAPLKLIGENIDRLNDRLVRLHKAEDLNEYLYFVRDGASRMNAMVDDLLHYCDPSSEHHPSPVSTEEVLSQIESNLSNLLIREGARLQVQADMPNVIGHKTEVLQLFQNLISNGIKFRKPSGIPICKVGFTQSHKGYCFSVSDNGIGIPANRVNDVFGLFTRLHEWGSYEGTGIGLALCKRIVLSAGGEIWAESSLGKGTTFYFTWPMPVTAIGSLSNDNIKVNANVMTV